MAVTRQSDRGQVRRSRRALLAAASAALLGVACGRVTSSPSDAREVPSGARLPGRGPDGVPRRGGVLRTRIDNDYVNLDPHATAQSSAQWVGMLAYSRLLRYALGPGEDNLDPRLVPDTAAALGEQVDALTLVFRLRDEALFHDLPPVYGRRVTAADVRLSFERARTGKTGQSLAVIAAVQTPDDRTVVLKLKRPSVTLPNTLASAHGLFIMPYEADVRFDPSRQAIGAGPWMLERLEPAVQARWRPHPRHWAAGVDGRPLPYVDALVDKVIPEDATATAQFSAAELDLLEVQPSDLFAVQDAVPDVQVVAFPRHGFSFMGFSPRPLQPFRDQRVRQAFSIALDRQALLNVSYDTDRIEIAGLPVLRKLPASPLPARSRFWVDPETRPWGQYYAYRPAEARRLLESAGWDAARVVPLHFASNRYGRAYTDSVDAVAQLLGRVGVRVQPVGHDYSSTWTDVWQRGEFDGIGYFVTPRYAEPNDYLMRLLHSRGTFNPGRVRDPVLDALIEKQDTLFDENERQDLVREVLNRANELAYIPPLGVGTAMQYNVAQPWAGNVRAYYTTQTGAWYAEAYPHYWLADR